MYRYDAFVGVGKRGVAQPFIDKRLVDAARTHRVIVRLKGGHPMLFGRAQEETAALVLVGPQFRARPAHGIDHRKLREDRVTRAV